MNLIRPIIWLILLQCIGNRALTQAYQLQVLDQEGRPLVGASIFESNENQLVYTDAEGLATTTVVDSLGITYIGFETVFLAKADLLIASINRIFLTPDIAVLGEALVIGRRNERADRMAYAVETVDAAALQLTQSMNTIDALQEHAGVYVQKSQLGGGSPILRGFEANRVLLVVDGVRMNNAIFRSGHLQNAIMVDEGALERMEVIYGPGSLSYGSDALGGVIHFRTRTPQVLPTLEPEISRWSGAAGVQFASAGQATNLQADLTYRGRRWASYTAFGYAHYGDLRAGNHRPNEYPDFGQRPAYAQRINGEDQVLVNDDPNVQVGTAYAQLDLLQKIHFEANDALMIDVNLQWSTSSDIPRYDRLTEYRNGQLRFAEWYYGPQTRLLTSVAVEALPESSWADAVRVIAGSQFWEEDRHDRRFGDLWRETSLVDVWAHSLTIDAEKLIRPGHQLSYGIDATHNEVASRAFQTQIETGEVNEAVNARYPSEGSTMTSFGAYVQYRYQNSDSSLVAELGGRASNRRLKAVFGADDPIEWPTIYLDGIGGTSSAFTWAAGLNWQPGAWAMRAYVATGFRAPNVDDYAKFRESDGFIQVPNPAIDAERTLTTEISIGRWLWPGFRLSATAFFTRLEDAIVRQNFTLPDGSTFFVSRGDTLLVQANVNASEARVWGLSGQLEWRLNQRWRLEGNIQYTRGRRPFQLDGGAEVEVPLDHIPPLYGRLALSYRDGPWLFSVRSRFQGVKALEDYAVTAIAGSGAELIFDRTGSSDNLEQTPVDARTGAYTGAYGWLIVSTYARYRFGQHLNLRLGLENIFDRHYRPFASGVSAPGRNLQLGLKAWF